MRRHGTKSSRHRMGYGTAQLEDHRFPSTLLALCFVLGHRAGEFQAPTSTMRNLRKFIPPARFRPLRPYRGLPETRPRAKIIRAHFSRSRGRIFTRENYVSKVLFTGKLFDEYFELPNENILNNFYESRKI